MNEKEKSTNNGKWKIVLVLVFLIGVAIAISGYWYYFIRGTLTTDDARFAGGLLDIAPRISGQLSEVHVDEDDKIHKGQILFVLDREFDLVK